MRISDCSSDVCASDLMVPVLLIDGAVETHRAEARFQPDFVIVERIGAIGRQGGAAVDAARTEAAREDRQSVVSGTSVQVRVDPGCLRIIKNKITEVSHSNTAEETEIEKRSN